MGLYLLLLVPKTFSAHGPGKSNIQTLGTTSRVCIICLPHPSVWGCVAILNSNLVPNPVCNSFQNTEVNLASRSIIIEANTLCNRTISFKYNLASFFTGSVVLAGKKWAYLVIQSTITQMESKSFDDFGNLETKSIIIPFNFHSRMYNGCNKSPGLWCSAFSV